MSTTINVFPNTVIICDSPSIITLSSENTNSLGSVVLKGKTTDITVNCDLGNVKFSGLEFVDGTELGVHTLNYLKNNTVSLTTVSNRTLKVDSTLYATYIDTLKQLISVGYTIDGLVLATQISPNTDKNITAQDVYGIGLVWAPSDAVLDLEWSLSPEVEGIYLDKYKGEATLLYVNADYTGEMVLSCTDHISGLTGTFTINMDVVSETWTDVDSIAISAGEDDIEFDIPMTGATSAITVTIDMNNNAKTIDTAYKLFNIYDSDNVWKTVGYAYDNEGRAQYAQPWIGYTEYISGGASTNWINGAYVKYGTLPLSFDVMCDTTTDNFRAQLSDTVGVWGSYTGYNWPVKSGNNKFKLTAPTAGTITLQSISGFKFQVNDSGEYRIVESA